MKSRVFKIPGSSSDLFSESSNEAFEVLSDERHCQVPGHGAAYDVVPARHGHPHILDALSV